MARDIPLQAILQMTPQEVGVSGWHELTQAQINEFAHATGDFQWMHVDVERATREMGGTAPVLVAEWRSLYFPPAP